MYTLKSSQIKGFVVRVRIVKVQTEEYNNSLSLGGDNAASAYVLCPHKSFIVSISDRNWTGWKVTIIIDSTSKESSPQRRQGGGIILGLDLIKC